MLKRELYMIRLIFTGLFLCCLEILVPQSSTAQIFTDKNIVVIQPTDNEEDIIGKAAHVVPSNNCWLQAPAQISYSTYKRYKNKKRIIKTQFYPGRGRVV
jgi:hypothetical protein